MANFDFDLGLLEHQLHLARQNAIQTELAAAGLQEVGHPMLMCILHTRGGQGGGRADPAGAGPAAPCLAAAVATSLKSLEKKGYICREPEPGDARRNRVTLTDKGQRAVDDCFACLQRVTRRAFTGLSNEEQAVLRGFYLRMLDNLRGNSRPHSTPKEES